MNIRDEYKCGVIAIQSSGSQIILYPKIKMASFYRCHFFLVKSSWTDYL